MARPIAKRISPGGAFLSAAAISGGCYALYSLATSSSSGPERAPSLNPTVFAPYTLSRREQISSSSAVLTLMNENTKSRTEWRRRERQAAKRQAGIMHSVEVMQPDMQISRAYTPLPPAPSTAPASPASPISSTSDTTPRPRADDTVGNSAGAATPAVAADDDDLNTLRLLVRSHRPHGEVSSYLHALPPGALVLVRGPHAEYSLPPDVAPDLADVRDVLFLAGGTGIAPALRVAAALRERAAEREDGGVRMTVLWAVREGVECAGCEIAGALGEDGGTSSWSAVLPSSLRRLFSSSTTSPLDARLPLPPVHVASDGIPPADAPTTSLSDLLTSLRASHPNFNLSIRCFPDVSSPPGTPALAPGSRTTLTPTALRPFLRLPHSATPSLSSPSPTSNDNPTSPNAALLLLSGPPAFVASWAGPKSVPEVGRVGGSANREWNVLGREKGVVMVLWRELEREQGGVKGWLGGMRGVKKGLEEGEEDGWRVWKV